MARFPVEEELLLKLSEIDFAQRYYDFCKLNEHKIVSKCELKSKEVADILKSSSWRFRYIANEKLFCHEKLTDYGKIGLNLFFLSSNMMEPILFLEAHGVDYTDQVTCLAERICQLRTPVIVNHPPYPKMIFTNELELQEILDFCASFFAACEQVVNTFYQTKES